MNEIERLLLTKLNKLAGMDGHEEEYEDFKILSSWLALIGLSMKKGDSCEL